MRVIKRAGQQRFRLFDAKPRGEMTKIVVNRTVAEVKTSSPVSAPSPFKFSATVNGVSARVKWRKRPIPVAEARLADLFQSLEPRTIDRRAFKGGHPAAAERPRDSLATS